MAQSERSQTFKLCQYCGKSKPNARMYSQDVCDSCAQNNLGIVH
jgi:hypothetical protein